MITEDVSERNDVTRAGGTYPTAVPRSYFESSDNSANGSVSKKRMIIYSSRNTRLVRPAFGATRDEGAVGPVDALSPYADAVDHNRRSQKRYYLKPIRRTMAPTAVENETTVEGKGPTADTIISMIAAGKKPPVPEQGQIEEQNKSLSVISVNIKSAASRRIQFDSDDENRHTSEFNNFSNKISGYRQTWGAAFSQNSLSTALIYPPGPGGAKYPKNYPPAYAKPAFCGKVSSLNCRKDFSKTAPSPGPTCNVISRNILKLRRAKVENKISNDKTILVF